jgi:hypothetical protein
MFRRKLKQKSIGNKKNKSYPIKKFLFSLILAILAYLGLVSAEKSILQAYEKCTVVLVKKEIEENTVITKSNAEEYFYLAEIPSKLKTKYTATSYKELIENIACVPLAKGEIVSKSRFMKIQKILKEIHDPVEVSIEASDLSQMVGGILRQGDIINISVVNNVSKVNQEVMNSVYVTKVFDTNGKRISKTQKDASAVIINVIIDRKEIQNFNEKISLGDVRVCKVKKMQ